jgi:O-antigen/teichoic acid export membrane protein
VFAIADAGVSSAGNLAISLLAANALSLSDFGALTVGMLIGAIVVGLSRALNVDPLLLRYSADGKEEIHAALRRAIAAVVATAALVSIVVLLLALALGDSAFGPLIATAVVLPWLAQLDALRLACYALGQARLAFISSLVWTGLSTAGGVLVLMSTAATATGFLLVWGAAAGAAGLLVTAVLGAWPSWRKAYAWLRECRAISTRTVTDFALTQVNAQLGTLLVGVIAGTAQLGLIRKAQIPFGAIHILMSGGISFLQPSLVKAVAAGMHLRAARLARLMAMATSASAALITILLILVPDDWANAVLGGDWGEASQLLPFLGLHH